MSVYTDVYTWTYEAASGDPALSPGEYSIGIPGSASAYVYGAGAAGHYVESTQTDTGNLSTQDTATVGQDGMIFGVDTLPGMVVTQSGHVHLPSQPQAALDAYSALAGVWNDQAIRLVPGAVQVLRAYYPYSGVVRRCYGRARKIMPTYGLVSQGYVMWTSQFQAADNTWYADTVSSLTLTQVPSFAGGLTPPVTPPYQLSSQSNYQQNVIANTGSMPTWTVITFTGPIAYPALQLVNTPVTIGYNGVLKNGDRLVIDTRPWARSALLNGSPAAGNLSGDPMISTQIQPGSTTVKFTGQDYTGTATCVVQWRNATLAIGGSS